MQRIVRFFCVFTRRFFQDLVATRAASLAFTTLLSIVPLIIFIFYILSFFPALQQAGQQLENFVITHFIANSANAILQQLHLFVSKDVHTISWINIVALAFVGLLMIFNIVDAVNGVWHVKMTGFSALSLIFYWIILIIAPLVFAVLLLFSPYLFSLPFFAHFNETAFIHQYTLFFFPCLIEWITFTLFHWLMPSCRVKLRFAAIAGLITAVLFEIAKWGFVLYLKYFPTYELIYGALSTIPIFFLWVFLTWLIIIAGALVCQMLQVDQ